MKRNKNFAKIKHEYLFSKIEKCQERLKKENPDKKFLQLGIGDTTEPIPKYVADRLGTFVNKLGTKDGFVGYGSAQGSLKLRKKIAEKIYNNLVDPDEIFISDGAKSDVGRLQFFFGSDVKVALQDPTYPAYLYSSVISGKTGNYIESQKQYEDVAYMICMPENDFFPDVEKLSPVDLIYFCSPNNPTGYVATKEQLKRLVDFAKKNNSIIIFDSAYAGYIQDESLPKSIFEIEGAREVAIEVSSFSKWAGFTGVRLGFTVIPKELKFEDGTEVRKDWLKMLGITFNGASNISQSGGIACLEDEGFKAINNLIKFYLENAKILKKCLEGIGFRCYGADNAPYIWVNVEGQKSWETFDKMLCQAHIVTIPGVGFGLAGEGFVRFSAFGSRDDINEAVDRLRCLKE